MLWLDHRPGDITAIYVRARALLLALMRGGSSFIFPPLVLVTGELTGLSLGIDDVRNPKA